MIHYFKQAWNLIRQEKLFSSIYIIGTGLSITVVMVLSILFYVKTANVYPETNRDRMLIMSYAVEEYGKDGISSSLFSYNTVETCFKSLKSAEAVSSICRSPGNKFVQPPGSREQVKVTVIFTDNPFWTVFPFRFVEGKPFTEADMQSGIHTAVIAESFAQRIFGRTDVVGEYVSLDFRPYRICGVVKDASFVTDRTYAQLWIPYTVLPDYKRGFGRGETLGPMTTFILAPSAGDVTKVKEEAADNIRRFAASLENIEFKVYGQPDTQLQSILRLGAGQNFNFAKDIAKYALIFFVLLLVPAVSLSGMTESRMERRLAEMGIRRAFGARMSGLLGQILSENLLFTLLGGLFGLLVSYLIIYMGSNWLVMLISPYAAMPPKGVDVVFTPAMLLNGYVFGIALLVCLVLNILSALIPAWRASRREIVYSLKM